MAAEGPNYPAEATNYDWMGFGLRSWSDLTYIGADDSNYAYAESGFMGNQYTMYALATNFGFSIPAGATIDGIEYSAEAYGTGGGANWYSFKSVKGGTIGGNELSDNSFLGIEETKSFGGSSNLCGQTWAAEDVNNSGFGGSLAIFFMSSMSYAYLNYISATVYYTPATPSSPVAAFSATPLTGTAPLSVTFTDASTNTPTSWLWEKSDDAGASWSNFTSGATSQNPTEEFTAGTWSIRLTATNAGGSDSETKLSYLTVTATQRSHTGVYVAADLAKRLGLI